MIAVIDYNMGNVGSVLNMLRKLGYAAKLTRDRADMIAATGLVLPGVGAFDRGMTNLETLGLKETLAECALERGLPVLGICLGMQLLTNSSEEGSLPGLGWIPAHTKRFQFTSNDPPLRVPHMGWAHVVLNKRDQQQDCLANVLFDDTEPQQRYYFVHSYHACCSDENDVLATASHGLPFTAALGRGNIVGTQFHPEKSHRYGLKLMENFAAFVSRRSLVQSTQTRS
jgi:imidazole glycerol-phosphate synthase subunit HisH